MGVVISMCVPAHYTGTDISSEDRRRGLTSHDRHCRRDSLHHGCCEQSITAPAIATIFTAAALTTLSILATSTIITTTTIVAAASFPASSSSVTVANATTSKCMPAEDKNGS